MSVLDIQVALYIKKKNIYIYIHILVFSKIYICNLYKSIEYSLSI